MHTLLITATYVFICVLNFHGWSQLRNFYNSEIFPIYGVLRSEPSLYWILPANSLLKQTQTPFLFPPPPSLSFPSLHLFSLPLYSFSSPSLPSPPFIPFLSSLYFFLFSHPPFPLLHPRTLCSLPLVCVSISESWHCAWETTNCTCAAANLTQLKSSR